MRQKLLAVSDTIVSDNARSLLDAVPYLLAAWRGEQKTVGTKLASGSFAEMLWRWCDSASVAQLSVSNAEGTAKLYTAVHTAFVPHIMYVIVLLCLSVFSAVFVTILIPMYMNSRWKEGALREVGAKRVQLERLARLLWRSDGTAVAQADDAILRQAVRSVRHNRS